MITKGARWIYVAIGTDEKPYATFAIAVKDGRVVEAPPIGRSSRMRLIGMDEHDAARLLRGRGAAFRPLP